MPLAVLNEAKVDGRHGHEFIHPFYPAELVIQYYHHEQALDKTFGPSIILRVGREETSPPQLAAPWLLRLARVVRSTMLRMRSLSVDMAESSGHFALAY